MKKPLKIALLTVGSLPLLFILFVVASLVIEGLLPPPSTERLLTQIIGHPLPAGVSFQTNISYFNPVLGDGCMVIVLSTTEPGISNMLDLIEWHEPDNQDYSHLMSHNIIADTNGYECYAFHTGNFTRVQLLVDRVASTMTVGAEF